MSEMTAPQEPLPIREGLIHFLEEADRLASGNTIADIEVTLSNGGRLAGTPSLSPAMPGVLSLFTGEPQGDDPPPVQISIAHIVTARYTS